MNYGGTCVQHLVGIRVNGSEAEFVVNGHKAVAVGR